VNVRLAISLALSAGILVAACADVENTNNDNDVARDAESSVSREFVQRAQDLLSGRGRPPNGTNMGVILTEDDKDYSAAWSVLTVEGDVTLLDVANYCDDDGDHIEEDQLWVMLDPGDLITWTEAGNDNRVCTGEVDIRDKGAALP
jgi:hypothetical protein